MKFSSPAQGFTLLLALALVVITTCFAATVAAIYYSQYRHENMLSRKPRSAQIARAALAISLDRLSQATDGRDNDHDGRIDEGLDWNIGLLAPRALNEIEGCLGKIGTAEWTFACDANRNGLPDPGEIGVRPVSFAGGSMIAFTVFSQEDRIDNDADGQVDEQDETGSAVVVATGIYRGAVTVIECNVSFIEPYIPPGAPCWAPETAFLAGGRLRIAGQASFNGNAASIHSNAELSMAGNCSIAGNATSSGGLMLSSSASVEGEIDGTASELPLPEVDPRRLRSTADFIVFGTGAVFDGRSRILHDMGRDGPFCGWSMRDGGFFFDGIGADPAAVAGTWWFDGNVILTGTGKAGTVSSAGGDSTQTLSMSVLATGSIEIAGDTRLRRVHPEGFLLVAGGDLRLAGEPHADQVLEGIIAAREQVRISGSPQIFGCIVAQDACDDHGLVRENAILGSPCFVWDGGATTGMPMMDQQFPWFKLDARVSSLFEK